MKRIMLLTCLPFVLASCETIGELPADAPEIIAVITAENAAQLRCPKNEQELAVLMSLRVAFDALTVVSMETRLLITSLRAQTNIVCNLPA